MSSGSPTADTLYYDPFDYKIDRNPQPIWERMREEAPVYWNERHQFYALSRFEDVWAAYHDTTTLSSTHGVELERLDKPVEFPSMIFMDPPEHDTLRKLVSRAFTPRRISGLEPAIQQLAAELLDPFVGTDGFDYIEQFGALLPPIVIGDLLGVPVADRDRIRRWFDEILHREEGSTEPSERAVAAGLEVFEYVGAMIAHRRTEPTDDLVTALIHAEIDDDGRTRTLEDIEVVSFVTLLAGAGVETVARFLSWSAVLLARNPDQRRLLVEDPSLLDNAVEEILRYEAPSPVNGRWSTGPYTVHGITIPTESKVLMLNGSANRDPREFTDPDTFDVRRSMRRHLSFGHGTHFCLGAALARMEARIGLVETLKRFPVWEIDEDALVPVHTSTVRGFSSVPIRIGA